MTKPRVTKKTSNRSNAKKSSKTSTKRKMSKTSKTSKPKIGSKHSKKDVVKSALKSKPKNLKKHDKESKLKKGSKLDPLEKEMMKIRKSIAEAQKEENARESESIDYSGFLKDKDNDDNIVKDIQSDIALSEDDVDDDDQSEERSRKSIVPSYLESDTEEDIESDIEEDTEEDKESDIEEDTEEDKESDIEEDEESDVDESYESDDIIDDDDFALAKKGTPEYIYDQLFRGLALLPFPIDLGITSSGEPMEEIEIPVSEMTKVALSEFQDGEFNQFKEILREAYEQGSLMDIANLIRKAIDMVAFGTFIRAVRDSNSLHVSISDYFKLFGSDSDIDNNSDAEQIELEDLKGDDDIDSEDDGSILSESKSELTSVPKKRSSLGTIIPDSLSSFSEAFSLEGKWDEIMIMFKYLIYHDQYVDFLREHVTRDAIERAEYLMSNETNNFHRTFLSCMQNIYSYREIGYQNVLQATRFCSELKDVIDQIDVAVKNGFNINITEGLRKKDGYGDYRFTDLAIEYLFGEPSSSLYVISVESVQDDGIPLIPTFASARFMVIGRGVLKEYNNHLNESRLEEDLELSEKHVEKSDELKSDVEKSDELKLEHKPLSTVSATAKTTDTIAPSSKSLVANEDILIDKHDDGLVVEKELLGKEENEEVNEVTGEDTDIPTSKEERVCTFIFSGKETSLTQELEKLNAWYSTLEEATGGRVMEFLGDEHMDQTVISKRSSASLSIGDRVFVKHPKTMSGWASGEIIALDCGTGKLSVRSERDGDMCVDRTDVRSMQEAFSGTKGKILVREPARLQIMMRVPADKLSVLEDKVKKDMDTEVIELS